MGRLSTGAPIFILLALCAAFLNLNQTWCKTIAFTIKNQITSELIIENQTLTGFVQFQRDIQVDIIMYLYYYVFIYYYLCSLTHNLNFYLEFCTIP